jgi:hypothetical protein
MKVTTIAVSPLWRVEANREARSTAVGFGQLRATADKCLILRLLLIHKTLYCPWQRTFNPLVAGSNPARPTTNNQQAHEFTFVGFLLSGRSLVASENVRPLPVRFDIENSSH